MAADLGAAVAAYRSQVEAVRVLEADALAAAGENEQLARRSYEAGQISLADWLLYRREFLETQREYLDRKLLCALTLVEIDTIAGVLR
jgi:cobalt-zinc-cadmium efflux system outer membrane protein